MKILKQCTNDFHPYINSYINDKGILKLKCVCEPFESREIFLN